MSQFNRWKKTALGLLALAAVAAAPAIADTPPVDVNSASATELTTISGIGPSKAKAIVDYREAHGPFASVDDLRSVTGIGDKLLERMRPQVTVGAPVEPETNEEKSE